MQNSMWKLATLLGVVGVGCLVVMQVQKQLTDRNATANLNQPAGESVPSTGDDGTNPAPASDLNALDSFAPADNQFEPEEKVAQVSFEDSTFGSSARPVTPAQNPSEPDAFVDFNDPRAIAQKQPAVPSADDFFNDDAFSQDPPRTTGVTPREDGTTEAALYGATAVPVQEPFAADAFDDASASPFDTQPPQNTPSEPGDLLIPDKAPADAALWGSENDRPDSAAAPGRQGAPQELPPIEDAFGTSSPDASPGPGSAAQADSFNSEPRAPGRVRVDVNAPKLPGFDDPPAPGRATSGAPIEVSPVQNEFDQIGPGSRPAGATPAPQEGINPLDDDPWASETPEPPAGTPGTPDSAEPVRSAVPADEFDSTPAHRGDTPGIRSSPDARYSEKSFDEVPHGTLKPQLRIEKTAPASASIGKPLVYSIRLRNVGNALANSIVVEDQIPEGVKLTGTIPQAELIDGLLVWRFDRLSPQEEKVIRVRVIPEREGQIGSVATVNFKAEIGVRTTVTAPKLKLTLDGHKEAKMGETVVFRYRISNVGSGDAQNVWLRNPLPPQLQHPEGNDLEYEVGDLPSGASRDITLKLIAAGAGDVRNSAVVTADGGLSAPAEMQVAILGAQLKVTRRGPARRYIGRNAVYENVVTNSTHRDAEEATLVEHVPEGMTFVKASDGGQYNELKRTVAWSIPRVRAGESLTFKVQLAPASPGQHESVVQIVEQTGFKSRANSVTQILHLNNMGLQLSELDGPVSVGEKIVFTIHVRNRGTSTATRSILMLNVPSELRVTEAGPLMARQNDDIVEFDAVDEIAPGESRQFQIAFVADRAATDIRLRASIQSDQMPRRLITEESITVYDDGP